MMGRRYTMCTTSVVRLAVFCCSLSYQWRESTWILIARRRERVGGMAGFFCSPTLSLHSPSHAKCTAAAAAAAPARVSPTTHVSHSTFSLLRLHFTALRSLGAPGMCASRFFAPFLFLFFRPPAPCREKDMRVSVSYIRPYSSRLNTPANAVQHI